MVKTWQSLQGKIDPERHRHVSERLEQQMENAQLWRQVCISYFGRFASSKPRSRRTRA
jgi:alpha-glucuronidase